MQHSSGRCRLAWTLAAALIVMLVGVVSPAQAVARPSAHLHPYAYDAAVNDSVLSSTTTERAPPSIYGPFITFDTVAPCSNGASPFPNTDLEQAHATYDDPVLHMQPDRGTTARSAGAIDGDPSLFLDTGVAANNGRLLAKADRIEQHLTRLDPSPANDAMLARIRGAATNGSPLSRADRAFMRHESTEGWLMNRGLGYGAAHRMAGWTHRTYGNYDPSAIKQFPEMFNHNWRNFWGIE